MRIIRDLLERLIHGRTFKTFDEAKAEAERQNGAPFKKEGSLLPPHSFRGGK